MRIQDSSSAFVNRFNIKANFGFYDVYFYKNEKERDDMQVVYGVYNGVVVIKNINE